MNRIYLSDSIINNTRSSLQDHTKYKEPTSLFEHFIIVGLHPEANLVCVEDAFARRKKWESEMAKSEMLDLRVLQYPGPSLPTLEPQVYCMNKSVLSWKPSLLLII